MASTLRKVYVIHDTDLHGGSCGINAYYALRNAGIDADVYSHFSTNPNEPSTTPVGLAQFIENLGNIDLIILDIPIDVRNPKRYVDALVSHAKYKGRVVWLDHHGHSQWVDELNRNGVFAAVFGTSYDLALAVPRMFAKTDSFTEKWALIGAVGDFDESIANRVSTDLEIDVAEYLDQAWKFHREQLAQRLGIPLRLYKGNVGFLTAGIAELQIEPEQVIEVAKQLVSPLVLPRYEIVGDVVYTTELPAQGLAWKTAWKLCAVTGAKVAIVPTYNPRTNQYAIIIAKNWRHPEVTDVIEQYIQRRFSGRQIVGHPGARSISMMSLDEAKTLIPQVARELNEEISRTLYVPRAARLISDRYVAEAVHSDFQAIMRTLAEILNEMRRMYSEYLELKKRQVELLEKISGRREEASYD